MDRAGQASGVRDAALVAGPFLWLGAVLAISLIETPLKFQAPGVTTAVGLQIGRLVFPVLNSVELVLCLLLTVLLARRRHHVGRALWTLVGGLWAILSVQAFVLRPVLDKRAVAVIAGRAVPPAPWHLAYIGLEGVKVFGLVVVGVAVVRLTVRAAAASARSASGDGHA